MLLAGALAGRTFSGLLNTAGKEQRALRTGVREQARPYPGLQVQPEEVGAGLEMWERSWDPQLTENLPLGIHRPDEHYSGRRNRS